jgi:hypothetical protein
VSTIYIRALLYPNPLGSSRCTGFFFLENSSNVYDLCLDIDLDTPVSSPAAFHGDADADADADTRSNVANAGSPVVGVRAKAADAGPTAAHAGPTAAHAGPTAADAHSTAPDGGNAKDGKYK